MKIGTSLYLDILRFGAALLVFLSHIGPHEISGGVLWQFMPFGSAVVIIFFVLSGYVIGFVTHTKEQDLRAYSLARLGRLYSVAVPALFLTVLLDVIRQFYFLILNCLATIWFPITAGGFLSVFFF